MSEELITELEDLCTRLGIDHTAEFGTLRDFATGPPVVLVTGPARPDRTRLATALGETAAPVTVTQAEIAAARDRFWDLLVLVSPADKLLPTDERELLTDTLKYGCGIRIVVTGLHRLGDEEAARAELEQRRLRPLLTPRGLPWWFAEPNDTSPGLSAEIAELAGSTGVHDARIRAVLRALADDDIAACAPRVAERERHLELLDRLRRQLGPDIADVADQVRVQALVAKDQLSEPFERFYGEVGPTVDRALTWLANDRVTPWDDVVHPLQQQWAELAAQAVKIPARQAAALHEQLGRIVKATAGVAGQLGGTVEQLSFAGRTWTDPATAEALGRLADIDLVPVLERFHEQVLGGRPGGEPVPDRQPAPSPEPEQKPELQRPPGRIGQLVERVGSEFDERFRKPGPEQLFTRLDTGLRSLIGPRATAVVDTVQRLVAAEGGADATATAGWLEATVKVAADETDVRHRWYDAYRDLLAYRERL